MKQILTVIILMALIGLSGCSRIEKVRATEAGSLLSYESLGIAQINRKAPKIIVKPMLSKTVEFMTFGLLDGISREEHLQNLLKKDLEKLAKEKYGAEAVVNVKYWPDLTEKKFPEGLIHAQGEMIRYERFPE